MPKRNNMRGGNRICYQNIDRCNGNVYVEHDDLRNKLNCSKNTRRVSFKPTGSRVAGGRQFNNKQKRLNVAIKTKMDDDVNMEDFPNCLNSDGNCHRNPNSRIRRHRSPVPRTGHGTPTMRKLVSGTLGWFLVTVPHGQKYDKELVLRDLQTLVLPELLIPHYVKVESSALCFYVNDIKIAQMLLDGDRRITLPNGFKMIIRVRNSIPHVQIDANLKEKMKLAMGKRYIAAAKSLDLTKFHTDVDLKEIFCALFRPTIMLAAIDIIAENIPDLEALDLSDNNIYSLDHLKCLVKKLPCLKVLHLANNKITSPKSLDALKECQLVDLVLKGNPLKDNLLADTIYTRYRYFNKHFIHDCESY